jgi:DNA-binding response OmpR family regulator
MTLRILIASKNNLTVDRLKNAFADVDCEVIRAPTLSLGLYLARKNFPDVILSELELADGGGLQLLFEVRAETELQMIPFALMSTFAEAGLDEVQAEQLGIAAAIGPDAEGRELYEKVMKLIRGYLAIKEQRPEETPE